MGIYDLFYGCKMQQIINFIKKKLSEEPFYFTVAAGLYDYSFGLDLGIANISPSLKGNDSKQ